MHECDIILAQGLFETTFISSSKEVKDKWEKWWYFASEGEARDRFSLGLAIPFNVPVTGKFDGDAFNSWKKSVSGRFVGEHWSREDVTFLQSKVSGQAGKILDSFNECHAITGAGLHLTARAIDADDVLVTIKYNAGGDHAVRPLVASSLVKNGTTSYPGASAEQLVPPQTRLPFGALPIHVRRTDVRESVLCTLYTDQGSAHVVCGPLLIGKREIINISAWPCTAGALNIASGTYGTGIYNSGGKTPLHNRAKYVIKADAGGKYEFHVRYAAAQSRPVELTVNGHVVKKDVAKTITGGWGEEAQKEEFQCIVELNMGDNLIELYRIVIPHISMLIFKQVR